MEAQGDEGTVRHRRKFVVLGTALPAASEARHSGHRLAPTGKGLPTRLPRSGLVQSELSGTSSFFGRPGGVAPTKFAGSPSPARHEGKAAPTLRHTYRLLVWRPVFIANLPLGSAWWGKVIRIVPYQGVHWHMVDLRALR
jgi:hypothetical protein